MDKFSSACNFPSKPDGYKNTSSSEPKVFTKYNSELNEKIGYTSSCKIN